MSGTGIPTGAVLKSEEEREQGRRAVERQEKFLLKHPEIDIKAERDHELVFRVIEPGREDAVWSDPNEMMDDLEARYPDE